jgi:hypothetical protein
MRGRTVALSVSRRLPTTAAAARVRTRVLSCGICFLRALHFPLTNIPPTAPHSSPPSITRGRYNRPNSGRHTKWTHSHPIPNVCDCVRNRHISTTHNLPYTLSAQRYLQLPSQDKRKFVSTQVFQCNRSSDPFFYLKMEAELSSQSYKFFKIV